MIDRPLLTVASRTLLAAVLETRNYIVGEANAPSGLYRWSEKGWSHAGWRNARATALAIDPATPTTLFLASGNGVLRTRDGGTTWRVSTDWWITEVLDVTLDPFAPGGVYAATAYGVWRSADEGDTWTALPAPAPHPNATFAPTLVLDEAQEGRVLLGTEDGSCESADGGQHWRALGPRVAVRALAQSAVRPAVWLAGTRGHGVLLSTDGGRTWTAHGDDLPVYTVALDPSEPQQMAAGGLGPDLLASTDGGARWEWRRLDVEAPALHALAFDPDRAGRLWLGTVGEGVFVTDDFGETCQDAGLPDTTVYDLVLA